MGTRRFELTDSGSNKFWEITVSGCEHTVRFGRIGSTGQCRTKTFDTAAEARKSAEKLVAQKTRKGYGEVGSKRKVSKRARKKAARQEPDRTIRVAEGDDLAAALSQAKEGARIELAVGTHRLVGPLTLRQPITWVGGKGRKIPKVEMTLDPARTRGVDNPGVLEFAAKGKLHLDRIHFVYTDEAGCGALLWCHQGEVVIEGCKFQGARANGHNGNAISNDAQVYVRKCRFDSNAGIAVATGGTTVVEDCKFERNGYALGAWGQARLNATGCKLSRSEIYATANAELALASCVVEKLDHCAVGVYESATVRLTDCTVRSVKDSSALHLMGNAKAEVRQCTLSGCRDATMTIDGQASLNVSKTTVTKCDTPLTISDSPQIEITDSLFEQNRGAAISALHRQAKRPKVNIERCRFINTELGAIYAEVGTWRIVESEFQGNGGAAVSLGYSPKLEQHNNTFADNAEGDIVRPTDRKAPKTEPFWHLGPGGYMLRAYLVDTKNLTALGKGKQLKVLKAILTRSQSAIDDYEQQYDCSRADIEKSVKLYLSTGKLSGASRQVLVMATELLCQHVASDRGVLEYDSWLLSEVIQPLRQAMDLEVFDPNVLVDGQQPPIELGEAEPDESIAVYHLPAKRVGLVHAAWNAVDRKVLPADYLEIVDGLAKWLEVAKKRGESVVFFNG